MINQVALTVVQLNNSALAHFLNGDHDKAIVLLRMAFQTFEAHRKQPSDLVVKAEQDSQHQSLFNFTQPSEEELPTLMDCDVGTIVKEKLTRSMHVEQTCLFASPPSTAYSMYNRALVLSDDQDDYSLLVRYQHRTGAIILYNLALVHHNIGIHLGASTALPHALRLYEMAFEAIDQQGASLVDVQILLLALLNNMGNIHTHLFHFENAQRCLENLRMVVLAASSSTMAMDEDYIFFFINSLYQGKELCFAPAA
jgi:tetratricopeptide (TPR) repeat protein